MHDVQGLELVSYPYYWGPIDSLHTFCEPKYATHPMAAEFYNSIGSLIYCVAASVGLYKCSGMVWQVQCGWWALMMVGMGSTGFHLTMRYNAELGDELPMLVPQRSGSALARLSPPHGSPLLQRPTHSVPVALASVGLERRARPSGA